MSDREEPGPPGEEQPDPVPRRELLPPDALAAADEGVAAEARLAPVLIAPAYWRESVEEPSKERPAPFGRPRLVLGAAIAAAAVLVGGAVLAIDDHRSQADMIARQTDRTEALARTIDALNARLNVIESARSHDELVELRRSVGEIRSNASSSRELSGAIARLAIRIEKLDRDESAKVDRLNERVDREASAQSADLAARIDKLEKKAVASAASVPAAANPPAQQKPSGPPPRLGSNVSMETTGSIERPRPVLRGYIVLGARDDVALIEGRNGERAVRRGDFLPGAGRVEGIARTGGSWVVLTERGQILAADEPD